MNRDMSCELDGVFMGRNAGELVSTTQPKTVMTRTAGLAEYQTKQAYNGTSGYQVAPAYKGSGLGVFTIPGLGTVDFAQPKTLAIVGGVAAVAWFLFLRKK